MKLLSLSEMFIQSRQVTWQQRKATEYYIIFKKNNNVYFRLILLLAWQTITWWHDQRKTKSVNKNKIIKSSNKEKWQ
jgi:hypothetical protein